MPIEYKLDITIKCDKCGDVISDYITDGWDLTPNMVAHVMADFRGWKVDGEYAFCSKCLKGKMDD